VGIAAFAFLLSVYARVWSPAYGITRFITIGREFNLRGIAVFRDTPKYMDPDPTNRWGFDGQYYAQLALDPLLRDPQLRTALDNPPYRARRILLPWLAWLGGLGKPIWILNAYAALNPIFWIGYAVMMGALFRPRGWAGAAGFAAMLLTCGVIESMRQSLSDFPAWVLMTGGVIAGGTAGAGIMALAGLAREVDLLGLAGLVEIGRPWKETTRMNLRMALIAVGPLAVWLAYVTWRFGRPQSLSGESGNLDWPFRAIAWKLGELAAVARGGGIHWLRVYRTDAFREFLAIVAIVTQCAYLLIHREWENRLWRLGAVFIPYLLCIGQAVWLDHITITRHALPVTLAFNVLLASRRGRFWCLWFVLGNCCVPWGIYDFGRIGREILPASEITIAGDPSGASALSAKFGEGWFGQERNFQEYWRWTAASKAEVVLSNAGGRPIEARLTLRAMSYSPRELRVRFGSTLIWSGRIDSQPPQLVATAPFVIPPGDSTLSLETPQSLEAHGDDPRPVAFMVTGIRLDAAPP
jgi:hypothetical protein